MAAQDAAGSARGPGPPAAWTRPAPAEPPPPPGRYMTSRIRPAARMSGRAPPRRPIPARHGIGCRAPRRGRPRVPKLWDTATVREGGRPSVPLKGTWPGGRQVHIPRKGARGGPRDPGRTPAGRHPPPGCVPRRGARDGRPPPGLYINTARGSVPPVAGILGAGCDILHGPPPGIPA